MRRQRPNQPEPILRILLLTEDSRSNAFEILSELTKHLLRLVDPKVQLELVGFVPLPKGQAQYAAHANRWKSEARADHSKIVTLVRTIANELIAGSFVFFHFDGDRAWKVRRESENVRQFERKIVVPLQQALRSHFRDDTTQVRNALARLRRILPFYSVESWLFQNTSAARAFCNHPGCRTITCLMQWEQDPGLLDELSQVKEMLCFKDRHNLELARTLPAPSVLAARKSFWSTKASISSAASLRELLARTHRTY